MDVLLITGPAGVGMSTVALELSRQLVRRDIPHALIDTDEFDRIYPAPPDLFRVTQESLSAVWTTLRRFGAERLILVGVYLDSKSEREWIARAVGDPEFTCVRLLASEASLAERVSRREIGSGAADQLEKSMGQLWALGVDAERSGRTPVDIAGAITSIWLPDFT